MKKPLTVRESKSNKLTLIYELANTLNIAKKGSTSGKNAFTNRQTAHLLAEKFYFQGVENLTKDDLHNINKYWKSVKKWLKEKNVTDTITPTKAYRIFQSPVIAGMRSIKLKKLVTTINKLIKITK